MRAPIQTGDFVYNLLLALRALCVTCLGCVFRDPI